MHQVRRSLPCQPFPHPSPPCCKHPAGVVNVYTHADLLTGTASLMPTSSSASAAAGMGLVPGSVAAAAAARGTGKPRPLGGAAAAGKPAKELMNLTTQVDCLAFSPDSQVRGPGALWARTSKRMEAEPPWHASPACNQHL